MNIAEGNKLIAEFIGYKEFPQGLYEIGEDFDSIIIYEEYQENDEYLTIGAGKRVIRFKPEEMLFHSSWDWLMPIVDLIEVIEFEDKEFRFVQYTDEITIFEKSNNEDWREFIVVNSNGEGKLKNTYEVAVEFIQWYNKNKH